MHIHGGGGDGSQESLVWEGYCVYRESSVEGVQ